MTEPRTFGPAQGIVDGITQAHVISLAAYARAAGAVPGLAYELANRAMERFYSDPSSPRTAVSMLRYIDEQLEMHGTGRPGAFL